MGAENLGRLGDVSRGVIVRHHRLQRRSRQGAGCYSSDCTYFLLTFSKSVGDSCCTRVALTYLSRSTEVTLTQYSDSSNRPKHSKLVSAGHLRHHAFGLLWRGVVVILSMVYQPVPSQRTTGCLGNAPAGVLAGHTQFVDEE